MNLPILLRDGVVPPAANVLELVRDGGQFAFGLDRRGGLNGRVERIDADLLAVAPDALELHETVY
jgi:hypothetical protein